jgi:hypothetical protein
MLRLISKSLPLSGKSWTTELVRGGVKITDKGKTEGAGEGVGKKGALWNLHDTDHQYSLDWRLDAPQI